MTSGTAFSSARRAFLRGRQEIGLPLRPPWAISEPMFVEACNGCGDCVSACPEHVLVVGDGGYPTFDPLLGECLFCAACVEACDADAFDAGRDPPWTIQAKVGSGCLAQNGVTCFSCRDACSEAAIRFRPALGGAHPDLDPTRCTGCGACVGVCPVSAISLAVPDAAHG